MRTFTALEIVQAFKEHTGFEFQNTVPGQLLARSGIKAVGTTAGKKAYPAEKWVRLWQQMLQLADDRCRYKEGLVPPTKRGIPMGPLAGSPPKANPSTRRTPAEVRTQMDRESVQHLKAISREA